MTKATRIAIALVAAIGCACAGSGPNTAANATDPRMANAWFAAGRADVARSRESLREGPAAKNVILFVADGMGISTVTAARILEGQMRGESGEESWLAFERLPQLALSKTYATDAQVPDSAATMTAMMTGVKTKIGTLGVDERVVRGDYRSVAGTSLMTILEEAEQRGLATGVVSTATVTHATPAACYGHAAFRFWENDSLLPEDAREAGFPDLARQLVELPYGDGLEVALGGGRVHFHPQGTPDPENPESLRDAGARLDGRNLVDEWTSERPDARYVWNLAQLQALDLGATERLLGLFDPRNMKWEADRLKDEAGEPSLAEMTATAIALLSRDRDGYFLMVEGGRIDHAHHNGNAYRALTDTIAFSDAVRVAMEATDADETLIVVTADHSHAFTISGYPMRGNPILGKVVATNWLGDGATEISHDALGLPYTTLSYANGPGYTGASERQPEGVHHMHHRPCSRRPPFLCTYAGIENGRPDLSHVDTTDSEYLQEATVPMGMETHAGEDVAIYAGGPRAALFHGVVEQSYIYHAMVEALGWTKNGEAAPLE